MSEKRFSVRLRSECDGVVYSFFDGDKPLDVEMIVDVLNEQQATIRKLQDLCGESDYENAKLREEVNLLRPTNIEQYEQIQKLQEENEQLRQQQQRLYNYFRDYLENEMSGNAFSEMWDFVKEDEKWEDE